MIVSLMDWSTVSLRHCVIDRWIPCLPAGLPACLLACVVAGVRDTVPGFSRLGTLVLPQAHLLTRCARVLMQTVKNKPLITWNMELDNLRADLGLLGFPPKDLQYRFLSTIKPVFYIRQRDYSKTVSVSPFIINYSGALFREYPGPWQAMLRQDNGTYACVAEREERYPLGGFKLELSRAMGLDVEEEGSTIQFLRTGRRTTTWWEDEEEGGAKEESRAWRS